jgi:hypothetical protein
MDTELSRVSERISASIVHFASVTTQAFFMDDLRKHVTSAVGEVAPDSPGRVLRDLRQKKQLNYRVISRSESLYEFV